MKRSAAAIVLLAALGGGCGSWQRAGTEPRPRPEATIPQLFDVRAIYRGMGFLVGPPPLGFVASLRFLAGGTPDSTLAVFALSLANRSLSFRKSGEEFLAEYHVDVALRAESTSVREVERDEAVRVHGFQETLRTDESVVFQQFFLVRPGAYTVRVVVHDRNGPAASQDEAVDTVPRFGAGAFGSPLTVYRGTGRSTLDAMPLLVVNPRATLPYGGDSLRFYVEGYGLAEGARVAARALDADSLELWSDTVTLVGDRALGRAELAISPGTLPVGRAELLLEAVGTGVRARAPLLVSLSDRWAIANFDQVISLLRYFPYQGLLAKLRAATPDRRATLWYEFFKATDPVPVTPENEALEEYFGRIGIANARFAEGGTPGWLTDRGEVFITLGEPDEVFDLGPEVTTTGVRGVRWEYTTLRLTLYFEDETGFGQYRLTPTSRAEYQRVLTQVRAAR